MGRKSWLPSQCKASNPLGMLATIRVSCSPLAQASKSAFAWIPQACGLTVPPRHLWLEGYAWKLGVPQN